MTKRYKRCKQNCARLDKQKYFIWDVKCDPVLSFVGEDFYSLGKRKKNAYRALGMNFAAGS